MKNPPRCEDCKHYKAEPNEPWVGSCAMIQSDLGLSGPAEVVEDFGCVRWECKDGLWEAEVNYV